MRKLAITAGVLVVVGTVVSIGISPTQAQEKRCRVEAKQDGTAPFWGVIEHEYGHTLVGAHGNWHQVTPEWRFAGRPESLSCQLPPDFTFRISWDGSGEVGGDSGQFSVEVSGNERIDEDTYRGTYSFVFQGKTSGRIEEVLDVVAEVQDSPTGVDTTSVGLKAVIASR
jgi:hypothetical protein